MEPRHADSATNLPHAPQPPTPHSAREDADSARTSTTLIEALKNDEPRAWDRFLRLYAPLVSGWIRRGGTQGADQEDIAQNVFASVFRHIKQFCKSRPDHSFRGWLRVITQRKISDFHRRTGGRPVGRGGSSAQRQMGDVPAPDESSEFRLGDSRIRDALDRVQREFDPITYEKFFRFAVEGQSASAIAKELGGSDSSVRMAKCRVLARLKKILDVA